MKVLKPNSSQNTLEIEISADELQLLETALSYARRSLSSVEIEKCYGKNLELEYLIEDVRVALQDFEKTQPQLPPKAHLKKLVSKFKKWISDNYDDEAIKNQLIDDPGYPNWEEIEHYFREILKNNRLKDLDKEDRINLLYLIARNWDLGSMIGWFSAAKPLSHCGDLSDEEFIDLAKIVAGLNLPEFNDAKSQFASSMKKLGKLTPEIEEILLQIYENGDEYSKRHALISLAKLGYKKTKDLVKKSWENEDEEHHKMACLEIIKEDLKDLEMLQEYLEKSSTDKRQYISEFVKKLKVE